MHCTLHCLINQQDGLFSAVVTGFIVLSVSMLQEDTGQAAVNVLSIISQQLSSSSKLGDAPIVNPRRDLVVPSTAAQFQPSIGARWINALWFSSLTLSLASAVFGIMFKEWIREYLQWRSATCPSRTNVVVRQIRLDSWTAWRTPALIYSISALLELAVILFVCGLTIFVWTLDYVVATVLTFDVAVFLSLVAFFTLMPAVRKCCPYKSPTAWAFILL